jgi:hypothetical protein
MGLNQLTSSGLKWILPSTLVPMFLLTSCATPVRESVDKEANYQLVFGKMRSPVPRVIHSRIERTNRRLLGFPLGPVIDEWEFELIASPEWVKEVKVGFIPISATEVWNRKVPAWFSPDEANYEVLKLHPTSYPRAHLYIERNPKNKDQIHVFIRRH